MSRLSAAALGMLDPVVETDPAKLSEAASALRHFAGVADGEARTAQAARLRSRATLLEGLAGVAR